MWRYPSPTDAAYFMQLADWGYSLSEVEQIAAGTTGAVDSETGQAASTPLSENA